MKWEGKARRNHGGNTHIEMSVTSMVLLPRALTTRGKLFGGVSIFGMFKLITFAFLYQVPETYNKQSPEDTPAQDKISSRLQHIGRGMKKHSRTLAEAPDYPHSQFSVP